MKLKEKILKDGDVVKFVSRTTEYGAASFQVCTIVNNGFLSEVYIYPKQQPDAEFYYRIILDDVDCELWMISSWSHRKIGHPYIGFFNWCDEHQCQSVSVSSPPDANCFTINIMSVFYMMFDNIK